MGLKTSKCEITFPRADDTISSVESSVTSSPRQDSDHSTNLSNLRRRLVLLDSELAYRQGESFEKVHDTTDPNSLHIENEEIAAREYLFDKLLKKYKIEDFSFSDDETDGNEALVESYLNRQSHSNRQETSSNESDRVSQSDEKVVTEQIKHQAHIHHPPTIKKKKPKVKEQVSDKESTAPPSSCSRKSSKDEILSYDEYEQSIQPSAPNVTPVLTPDNPYLKDLNDPSSDLDEIFSGSSLDMNSRLFLKDAYRHYIKTLDTSERADYVPSVFLPISNEELKQQTRYIYMYLGSNDASTQIGTCDASTQTNVDIQIIITPSDNEPRDLESIPNTVCTQTMTTSQDFLNYLNSVKLDNFETPPSSVSPSDNRSLEDLENSSNNTPSKMCKNSETQTSSESIESNETLTGDVNIKNNRMETDNASKDGKSTPCFWEPKYYEVRPILNAQQIDISDKSHFEKLIQLNHKQNDMKKIGRDAISRWKIRFKRQWKIYGQLKFLRIPPIVDENMREIELNDEPRSSISQESENKNVEEPHIDLNTYSDEIDKFRTNPTASNNDINAILSKYVTKHLSWTQSYPKVRLLNVTSDTDDYKIIRGRLMAKITDRYDISAVYKLINPYLIFSHSLRKKEYCIKYGDTNVLQMLAFRGLESYSDIGPIVMCNWKWEEFNNADDDPDHYKKQGVVYWTKAEDALDDCYPDGVRDVNDHGDKTIIASMVLATTLDFKCGHMDLLNPNVDYVEKFRDDDSYPCFIIRLNRKKSHK